MPPSLLERTNDLKSQAESLVDVDLERGFAAKLRTRREATKNVRVSLEEICASVKHVPGEFRAPQPSAALRRGPKSIAEQFAQNWKVAVDSADIGNRFLTPISTYCSTLRTAVLVAWKAFCQNLVRFPNDSVLATWQRIGFVDLVQQIRRLRDEFVRLQGELPTDVSVARATKIGTEVVDLLSNLEGMPPAVTRFLEQAVRREARIADLTSEVREWLQQNNILDQLAIGFD